MFYKKSIGYFGTYLVSKLTLGITGLPLNVLTSPPAGVRTVPTSITRVQQPQLSEIVTTASSMVHHEAAIALSKQVQSKYHLKWDGKKSYFLMFVRYFTYFI